MIQVALFYKEHHVYEEMYTWLDEAAKSNDPNAYYELANCYFEMLGNRGSEEQAFLLYKRAALKNHRDAMNNLADMYLNGEGTAVDEKKAFEWFTKAAEVGVVEAMYTLGIMYEQGLGTKINEAFALRYYKCSAQAGYDDEYKIFFEFMESTGQIRCSDNRQKGYQCIDGHDSVVEQTHPIKHRHISGKGQKQIFHVISVRYFIAIGDIIHGGCGHQQGNDHIEIGEFQLYRHGKGS